ncbi:MAG TPA: PIN domain-containing protein [Stellaceae bacterium]|nr:PIN domain-containing protein [Stellaceae bacterium]
MIYIDSSVVLARLLFEARSPSEEFWLAQFVSSRLLEYEVWNRVHAYGLTGSHANEARALLTGIDLVEMSKPVLAKALEPFRIPLRTLDSLHLATMDFLHNRGEEVELASYDARLIAAARALGLPLATL